jgi:hypothetical protein
MHAPPYDPSVAVPTYCIKRFPNHCAFLPQKTIVVTRYGAPEKVFVIWETINLQLTRRCVHNGGSRLTSADVGSPGPEKNLSSFNLNNTVEPRL